MSKRSFVSRRHKTRGDPRSLTGLQCGQAIVREGAQRPGMYTFVPFQYKSVAAETAAVLRRGWTLHVQLV